MHCSNPTRNSAVCPRPTRTDRQLNLGKGDCEAGTLSCPSFLSLAMLLLGTGQSELRSGQREKLMDQLGGSAGLRSWEDKGESGEVNLRRYGPGEGPLAEGRTCASWHGGSTGSRDEHGCSGLCHQWCTCLWKLSVTNYPLH